MTSSRRHEDRDAALGRNQYLSSRQDFVCSGLFARSQDSDKPPCRENPQYVAGDGMPPAPACAGDCAKRTQFGRSFKFEVSSVKRTVQNEPNSRRRQVGRGHRGVGRGANAQNEPNFTRSLKCQVLGLKRERLAGCRPGGQSCKTKPIPGDAGWAEAWGTRGNRAKRTQFQKEFQVQSVKC